MVELNYVAIGEILRIVGDMLQEGAKNFKESDKEMFNRVTRASDAAFDAYDYCLAKGCQKAGKA